MVVSSDSIKNATAISQGSKRLLVSVNDGGAPTVEDVEDGEEETDPGEALAGTSSALRSAEFEELEFGGLEGKGIVLRDSRSLPGFF
jgi:hypothetical protein